MTKLILHAGYHKTGTSAIQHALFDNREKLLDLGFYYPETGSFFAHHDLANKIKMNKCPVKGRQYAMARFKDWAEKGVGTVVFSSEMLTEGINFSCLSELRAIFDRIELVFYVRQQDLLFESAYGQLVKQNGEVRKVVEFDPYLLDLHKNVKRFDDVLRPDNVIVRVYDKKTLHMSDASRDFFTAVLDLDDLELFKFGKVANPSLSIYGLELLRQINASCSGRINRKKLCLDLVEVCHNLGFPFNIPAVGNLFSCSERELLMARAQPFNERLWCEYDVAGDPFGSNFISKGALDAFDYERVGMLAAEMIFRGYRI